MLKLVPLETFGNLPTGKKIWYVYFLKSTVSKKTYIGMTNDVGRRFRQHNGELAGGAKYTKGGRPWHIEMILGPYDTRSQACKVEWRAKRYRGAARFKYRQWVAELDNNAKDRYA